MAIMVILEAIVCAAAVFPKHAAPFGLALRRVRELRKEHDVVIAPKCKGAFKASAGALKTPIFEVGAAPVHVVSYYFCCGPKFFLVDKLSRILALI